MGQLLCSPGPRRRAQPSLLPHPSIPKFHLRLIAPPFPLVWFNIKLQDLWTWMNFFFFCIYNKYPGKEYSACVEVAKCSTEMLKVALGVQQSFSCGITTESPCWLQDLPAWTVLLWEDCYRYLSLWFGKKLLTSLHHTLQHDGGSVEILRELWFN